MKASILRVLTLREQGKAIMPTIRHQVFSLRTKNNVNMGLKCAQSMKFGVL